MYAKSLFALALALLPFSSASAEDVSYQAQTSFVPGQQASALNFPMPDAQRGAPIAMEIQLIVGMRGLAGIENLGKDKVDAVLFTYYGASVASANGQLHVGAGGQFALAKTLQASDGADDFIGASGAILALRHTTNRTMQRLSGKSLSAFFRDNQSNSLTLDVSGGASFSLLGPEYSVLETHTEVALQVQVTYRYKDEPSKTPSQAPGNQPGGFISQSQPARTSSVNMAIGSSGQK